MNEILLPYITGERERAGVSVDQEALVIMDVFKGQMTESVQEILQELLKLLMMKVISTMTEMHLMLFNET